MIDSLCVAKAFALSFEMMGCLFNRCDLEALY
jgi:hypothetical protein